MTSEDSTIPNRQVKDLSFQPTAGPPRTQQSPTGRLGIFHSNLQQDLRGLNNPQPAGWGSFIPAYCRTSADSSAIPHPAGWGSFIPANCRTSADSATIPQPAERDKLEFAGPFPRSFR